MTTESELKEVRTKLNTLGSLIDQVERELKPLNAEFLQLWKKKNQLEQQLFLEQGKIKVFSIGASRRRTPELEIEKITPKDAQRILDALEAD